MMFGPGRCSVAADARAPGASPRTIRAVRKDAFGGTFIGRAVKFTDQTVLSGIVIQDVGGALITDVAEDDLDLQAVAAMVPHGACDVDGPGIEIGRVETPVGPDFPDFQDVAAILTLPSTDEFAH